MMKVGDKVVMQQYGNGIRTMIEITGETKTLLKCSNGDRYSKDTRYIFGKGYGAYIRPLKENEGQGVLDEMRTREEERIAKIRKL